MSVPVANPRILLLGGHGKVSLLMTPRLLSRGWSVTSLIRDPAQESDIKNAGSNATGSDVGKLDVLVDSLEDVASPSDAKRVLDKVNPDWILWSAGAGGKGGSSRTHAIDDVAACAFARAAAATPSIKAFLTVSALSSRRQKAPWWSDEDWAIVERMNKEVLPAYYKAKLSADECLTAVAHKRNAASNASPFAAILLRPGGLSDGAASGKVQLGKTRAKGLVSRADAQKGWLGGWVDLLGGEEDLGDAVKRWISSGEDAIEGENKEEIYKAL
ncbi:hypothetical protein BDZ89DRAFT_1071511 [Hymenopellis radicata]|nr:hypothetical protein BDZ89DRAFT_1071511 [Hymenopellis radicata]